MKQAGADALMITPVSYNWFVPNDEGNYLFYKTISDTVDLPIIIYNVIPQNPIFPGLFKCLLEIKNVIGIKQSVGGITAFYEMILECGSQSRIYTANDDFLFTAFEYGAVGTISAIPVVFPTECIAMWNAARQGDHATGLAIQKRLFAPWKALGGSQFVLKMKYALKLLGRKPGYARSPLYTINEGEKKIIEEEMRKAGFIK
jgi:4-hydroxy-tetrahydrodipicolinate synthase